MSTENTPSTVTINENSRKTGENGQAQGSSTKAFAGVISLLLVIAGVYAMMKPMNQNLDYMRDDIKELKVKMNADDARERSDQAEIAKVGEKFIEVETQFRGLKEIMMIKDEQHAKEINRMRAELSEILLEVARLKECMKIKTMH